MDWYFGNDIDDFVVPKDHELLDRLPSPDSWLKWVVNSPQNSGTPNKYINANSSQDGLNFDCERFYHKIETETSFLDKDQSSSSSVCGGFSDGSLHLAAFSSEQPDYQLNELAGIEQMDDIFLSSLLEDQSGNKNLHKSFCTSNESQDGLNRADNLLKNIGLDSQSVLSNERDPGSSMYFDKHVYSSSVSLEKKNATDLQFYPCTSRKEDTPVSVSMKGLPCPEKSSTNGLVDKETSIEESVFQELETVMVQFTLKTRIQFRDSLYRLANNSKQQHNATQSLNGETHMEKAPPWIACDGTSRSGRKNATESKTNTIDRAIANLMFNNMESNVQAVPGTAIANFKQEAIKAKGRHNFSTSHLQNCQLTTLRDDAKVLVSSQRLQQTTAITSGNKFQ